MNTRPLFQSIIFILIGILTMFLLVGAKIIFEQTDPGRRFESYSYEMLQSYLPYFTPREEMPVIVLDISELEGDKGGKPTPRDKLTEIIDAVADENPEAIAINIDFSLNEKDRSWQDDEDPFFFSHCLELKNSRGIPVFLGIERTSQSDPEAWLGLEEYKSMAVIMRNERADTNRIYLWIKPQGTSDIIPGISLALAKRHWETLPPAPALLAPFLVKPPLEQETGQIGVNEYAYSSTLVNYSMLEAIESQSLSTITRGSIAEHGRRFKNKLVLIGRISGTNDKVRVVGRDTDVPGVLVNAAAAYSLIKAPLFEFTHLTRIVIDVILSLSVMIFVAFIRYRRRNTASHNWRRSQWLTIITVSAVVFLGGIILVRGAGIVWFDFLLVIAALLLHPAIEKKVGNRFHAWVGEGT